MEAVKALNLGLRFALELCALGALAYAGYRLPDVAIVRWVAAVAAPLTAAVIWGVFVAPNSASQLDDPARLLVELLVFGAAVAGLVLVDRVVPAVALGVVYAVNRVLVVIWQQ